EHRPLVEAGLEQARVVVGDALERVRDARALRAGDAARLLGALVARHRLGEVGARILADVALLLLGDELIGVLVADRGVLGRLRAGHVLRLVALGPRRLALGRTARRAGDEGNAQEGREEGAPDVVVGVHDVHPHLSPDWAWPAALGIPDSASS